MASGIPTSAQPRALRLTSEIIGRHLCVGSAGGNFLFLNLRLRFTNVGDRKLILYRGSNLFFTVWVNSNPGRPPAAQYELKTSAARYHTAGSEGVDKPAPTRDFIALSPGAWHETDAVISLPVVRAMSGQSGGAITAGEHLLRVTASTWYESKGLGEKLRERWRRRGELWLNPVVSEPMAFNSNTVGSAERCQG